MVTVIYYVANMWKIWTILLTSYNDKVSLIIGQLWNELLFPILGNNNIILSKLRTVASIYVVLLVYIVWLILKSM